MVNDSDFWGLFELVIWSVDIEWINFWGLTNTIIDIVYPNLDVAIIGMISTGFSLKMFLIIFVGFLIRLFSHLVWIYQDLLYFGWVAPAQIQGIISLSLFILMLLSQKITMIQFLDLLLPLIYWDPLSWGLIYDVTIQIIMFALSKFSLTTLRICSVGNKLIGINLSPYGSFEIWD